MKLRGPTTCRCFPFGIILYCYFFFLSCSNLTTGSAALYAKRHPNQMEEVVEMAGASACIKLEIDTSQYSSYVPVIGVFIAGASVVCFLIMFYDILSALLHKKTWIPCRLFCLNSLTLTLLAIAAKLPVDLTSSMPSALDQVSKLSRNSLVCISMGFLMPSLALKPKHDCMTNVLALSIFVVTLIVNTCVQIRTGVIFLFVAQHVITMCCMLAMLCPLWVTLAAVAKHYCPPEKIYKSCLQRGPSAGMLMLQRFKHAYRATIHFEPHQVVYSLSRTKENCTVAGLCTITAVCLIQPGIRNFSLEFCGGSSDYGKSVWVIALVQILTVLTGSFATILRAFGLSSRLKISRNLLLRWIGDFKPPYFKKDPAKWCLFLLELVLAYVNVLLSVLVCIPMGIVFKTVGVLLKGNYESMISDNLALNRWLKECDLEDLYNPAFSYGDFNLTNLISGEVLPFQKLKALFTGCWIPRDPEVSDLASTIQVSTLSVRRLVEISSALLSLDSFKSLMEAYGEFTNIYRSVYVPRRLDPYPLRLDLYPPERGRGRLSVAALREDLQWCEKDQGLEMINYMASKHKLIMENDSDKVRVLITKMFCEMVQFTIRELPTVMYSSLKDGRYSESTLSRRIRCFIPVVSRGGARKSFMGGLLVLLLSFKRGLLLLLLL